MKASLNPVVEVEGGKNKMAIRCTWSIFAMETVFAQFEAAVFHVELVRSTVT